MTTTFFAHIVRFAQVLRPSQALRRLARFSLSVTRVSSTTHVADARGRHPAAQSVAIQVIDDPEGTVRLVGVHGTVTPRNAHQLLSVSHGLGDRLGLHVDLSRASIPTVEALQHLEAAIDELERRGYKLRIVGVDPALPALIAAH